MNKKKVLWIVLLFLVIAGIIAAAILLPKNLKTEGNSTQTNTENFNKKISDNKEVVESSGNNQAYERIELEDGILYTSTGEKEKADVVITTNFFDTSLNDIYLNPQDYYNKKIEIEGMYLQNPPYTFVGRYSTSNVCQNCPAGYSYFEYQLKGNIDYDFKDEDTWIKVIGTLDKGNDETSDYEDYYFLNVLNLEIMNEKGQTTVVN